MFAKYRSYLSNKKGMLTIEYVMSLLIFIVLFSFVFDLTLITVQRNRATDVLQQMVRVVQVQSGVENAVPKYFPSMGDSYLTSSEFVTNSKTMLEQVGINANSVQIKISGTSMTGTPVTRNIVPGTHLQLKYKTPFKVTVSYQHQFSIWSNFAPGFKTINQELTAVGFAEYKQNYDVWEGE